MFKISEERRRILRDIIRGHQRTHKRAKSRQYWRDAIWDIIQQKRAKKQRLKRLVRKMAERRRAQKAAQFRDKIKATQEDRRCVICLSYHSPNGLLIQRLFKMQNVHVQLGFPKKTLNTALRMCCCKARVHMACVLQSMHSLYGRANKHLWRCVHCRRYLMDSREDDVFHIGLNDLDPLDSDDNEEIEHVHRIDPVHDPSMNHDIRWIRDESH